MPNPYHKLDMLIENLLVEFIRQNDDPGCPLYATLDAAEYADRVVAPCVTVCCDEWAIPYEDVPFGCQASANRKLMVSVKIRTQLDATKNGAVVVETAREAHAALKARIEDVFNVADIVANLNSVHLPGIYVEFFEYRGGRKSPAGRGIESVLLFEAHARAVEET